jgi:peptide chain release factor 2
MSDAILQDLQKKITGTWELLKLDDTRAQVARLQAHMQEPDFWNDNQKAQAVSQELSGLTEELDRWEGIQTEVNDALELLELAQAEDDTETLNDIATKAVELKKRFAELEFFVLLSDEHDTRDAIVTFHAGAGGADAQDWAQMLYRMITRYCEKQGWTVNALELSSGQEAGIKSALIEVSGRYAYGHLKSEHGTHRLVRISPFDAEGMRHTSFANIEVIPDLGDIAEVEINESELRIDVFRSGGNGGQSVNTTDSAVRIVHEPTGITAVCQNGKSQHQNKDAAMKILKSRLMQKYLEEQEAEKAKLRGEYQSAEWGNQIRSYVLHPYKMVKDHRTKHEDKNPDSVLDGDLQPFAESYLRWTQE